MHVKCSEELLTLSLIPSSRSTRLMRMFLPVEILAQVMLVTTVILSQFSYLQVTSIAHFWSLEQAAWWPHSKLLQDPRIGAVKPTSGLAHNYCCLKVIKSEREMLTQGG